MVSLAIYGPDYRGCTHLITIALLIVHDLPHSLESEGCHFGCADCKEGACLECKDGYHGVECEKICSPHCLGGCHRGCIIGCEIGWYGNDCDRACPSCSKGCYQLTGTCNTVKSRDNSISDDDDNDYTFTKSSRRHAAVIKGIATTGCICVILLVVTTCCRRREILLKEENSDGTSYNNDAVDDDISSNDSSLYQHRASTSIDQEHVTRNLTDTQDMGTEFIYEAEVEPTAPVMDQQISRESPSPEPSPQPSPPPPRPPPPPPPPPHFTVPPRPPHPPVHPPQHVPMEFPPSYASLFPDNANRNDEPY